MLRTWLKRGSSATGSLEPELIPSAAPRRFSRDLSLYRLVNQDRETILADRVRLAGTSDARRSGLSPQASLEITEGLALAPCEAIHTFGMRFSIDVIFLDARYRIRRIVERLKPNRIAVCFSAALVVELSSGALHRSRSLTGDLLRFDLVTDQSRACPDQGHASFETPQEAHHECPERLDLS